MVVGIARNFKQRCAAWSIVYNEYQRSGLIDPHPSGMWFTLLDLLPSSVTFIATEGSALIGTIGAVICTAAGMPAGKAFDDDFERLQIDGHLLCECTKLAGDSTRPGPGREVPLRLMASAIVWCRFFGVDNLFGVAHPRHTASWRRVFGFVESSLARPVSHVADSPGVLLHVDLRSIFTRRKEMPDRGIRMVRESLRSEVPFRYPHRVTLKELNYLLELRPELWRDASPATRMVIARAYPNFAPPDFAEVVERKRALAG